MLCAPGGQEIDEEAGDVEAIGKCNDPFQDSSNVPLVLLRANAKRNDETKFEDDEEELDPEGDAQNGFLTVMNTQALVFPADEDGTDDVTCNEDDKENVVQGVVSLAIENGEEDETGGTGDSGDGSAYGVQLLPIGRVWAEFVGVSQPSLENEGTVECYYRDDRHCNEHGLERVGTNILVVLEHAEFSSI